MSVRFSTKIASASVIIGGRLRLLWRGAEALGQIVGLDDRLEQTLLVEPLGRRPRILERAGFLQVLHELVHVVDVAGDHVQREHDAVLAIELGPDRDDVRFVRAASFPAGSAVGPRERPPIDQLVRLARGGGCRVDLPGIEAAAQLDDLLPQLHRARLVGVGLAGPTRCRPAVAQAGRHVQDRSPRPTISATISSQR
jgi:hypothetical protein